jgi:hypothetical protein
MPVLYNSKHKKSRIELKLLFVAGLTVDSVTDRHSLTVSAPKAATAVTADRAGVT